MRGWKQILADIRKTMQEFPSHFVMPGFSKKTPDVLNSVGAWAIEEAESAIAWLESENQKLREELARYKEQEAVRNGLGEGI